MTTECSILMWTNLEGALTFKHGRILTAELVKEMSLAVTETYVLTCAPHPNQDFLFE
jgi:hypothetical protein